MPSNNTSSDDQLIQTLQEEVQTFEALYLKEQTKTYWMIGVSVILAIALVVSLVTGPSNDNSSSTTQQAPFANGGFFGGGQTLDIQNLFLSDGSVDTSRLAIFENVPSQIKPRLLEHIDGQIEDALRDGTISETLADALYDELNNL